MTRYTRQQAKALGLPTCYGSPCAKHPELEGLRRVSGACTKCAASALRESRSANPERTRVQKRKDRLKAAEKPVLVERKRATDTAYRQANRQRIRVSIQAWANRNPDKVKQYAKKVKQTHKGAVNANTAKRRSARLQRTPAWLTDDDAWMISQAYALAAMRTEMFGFAWHVDHVLPLQGKTVSGLHTPLNLQVIPGVDNVRKGNRI